MRVLAVVLFVGCVCSAQQSALKYRLSAPKGWDVWMLTDAANEALSAYTYSSDKGIMPDIEKMIKTRAYMNYRPGDLAIFTGEEERETCRVKIIDGENRGREGWIHCSLMRMTAESKAYLAKREATKRAVAEEVQRKGQAYIDSLPKLTGQGQDVMVATSLDCARDLQNVINFGRKNGTGVEFRKKMLELVTLGCAATMANGTRWRAQ